MALPRVRAGRSQYIINGCMTQPRLPCARGSLSVARRRAVEWRALRSWRCSLRPRWHRSRNASRPLPRVHFVATGGTISNRDGGRLTAEELAKSMPGVERFAELTHEQFTNVASSELTLAQWLGLSKRINEVFAADKELAGIVVTSGTDTLEETAFFLHLTVRDPRPVVVVGSMRNPEHRRLRRRGQPARGRARGGRSGSRATRARWWC